MKLAHIAPTSILKEEVFKALDFHLCLASQVLKDPVYAEYYRYAKGFVILDVPTREEKDRKRPYDLDKLWKAIELVQPNEVTLPDIWGASSEITVNTALHAAFVLPQSTKRGALGFLAVPRGNTYEEYIDCSVELSRVPNVTTIGVVDGTYEKFKVDRAPLVTALSTMLPHVHLHLLGVVRNLSDVQNPSIRKRARSADTAKFVKFGLDCKHPIYGNVPDYQGRGEGYFEQTVSEIQMSYIAKNIRYWNSFARERAK